MNIEALNEIKLMLAHNKNKVLNSSNPQIVSRKNLQLSGYLDVDCNVSKDFKAGLVLGKQHKGVHFAKLKRHKNNKRLKSKPVMV